MADLAAKGSTVAIAAFEDPAYDFYLLKVTSNGVEELEEPMTMTIPANTLVAVLFSKVTSFYGKIFKIRPTLLTLNV